MAKDKKYGSPYTMKGSPMKRNFGISGKGSPMKSFLIAAGAAAAGGVVSSGLSALFGGSKKPPVEISNPAEGISKMQFGNKTVE